MKTQIITLILLFLGGLPVLGQDAKALSSYQEVSRLWIGLEEGVIEPYSIETIQVPVEGYYAFHVRDGDWLEENQHWLTAEPNKLQLEREELELEELKTERAKRDAAIESSEEYNRLEERLEEIVERRRVLVKTVALERESEGLPKGVVERVASAIEKLDGEAERVRELISEEVRQNKKLLSEKERGLQLERKRIALIASQKRSIVKAPFAGRLTLSTEVKNLIEQNTESNGLVWLSPGTTIGVIADRRTYLVRIPSENTSLDTLPEEEMQVMLTGKEDGKLIVADLLQIKQEQEASRFVQIFEFLVDEQDAAGISVLGPQKRLVHLFRTFEKPCRAVPKSAIAFEDATALQSGGWATLVGKIWPDAVLVAVGPQHLAIREKK